MQLLSFRLLLSMCLPLHLIERNNNVVGQSISKSLILVSWMFNQMFALLAVEA